MASFLLEEEDIFANNYQLGDVSRTGNVYTVHEGSFRTYPRVLVKKTSSLDQTKVDFATNEISMMQRLSYSNNIASLFHVSYDPSTISLIVQRYEFNLLRYLRLLVTNPVTELKFDEPTIFRQVFEALDFMHQQMIAHRNVKLKNVYIHRVSDSMWCVKLGGLKYAKEYDENNWSSTDDPSSPGPEEVDACRIPNNFQNDKYQVAVMMYFFLKRTYSRTSFTESFEPDWSDERDYDYKQLHMKHLIKMIHADPSLAISDILHHPYFMDANKMIEFEDGLWYFIAGNRAMDENLEINRSEVFTGRWTANFERELVSLCLGKSPPNVEETFVGLLEARIRIYFLEEDSRLIHDLMGSVLADKFAFWERIFPAFFLHLFTRIASDRSNGLFLHDSYEIQRSKLFPASPEFYAACSNTTIYEEE